MITILYIYKDKDIQRVKQSLISLTQQTRTDFSVLFVDYGSSEKYVQAVQETLTAFPFVIYSYSFHKEQPWSRAKAINIGLKQVKTDYVFVADIDMIFRTDFVQRLYELAMPTKAICFQVGFLSKMESQVQKKFVDYKVTSLSKDGAKGLSLFPIAALMKLNGFDEFFHFWGAEDEDIHARLVNAGLQSVFYTDNLLLLHQWHPTYRHLESKQLTNDLQLSHITRINQQHKCYNGEYRITKVNENGFGQSIDHFSYERLKAFDATLLITNKKESIDHFLFIELPKFNNGILAVRFVEDDFQKTLKYKIKKKAGMKVPKYYSLKEINDKMLLHIISYYHQFPYTFEVSMDLKSILFKIAK